MSRKGAADTAEKPGIFFAYKMKKRGRGGGFSAAARLLRLLRSKTSTALRLISGKGSRTGADEQAPSAPPPAAAAAPATESHLSEAFEDCIKFLHSSSTRKSC